MATFDMPNLVHNMYDSRTGYQRGEHYLSFSVAQVDSIDLGYKMEVYLTYAGLMRVLEVSRSGLGYKFKTWIDEVVFTASWGTQEQKIITFKRVLNVDAEHLRCIMSKSPTNISCLYLIDIDREDQGRKVFKYGFTDNAQRRFKEHTRRYEDAARLDTLILIPVLDLSKAETDFKHSVSRCLFEADGETELISLCSEGYINIKTILRTISEKYTGNMATQIAHYESEIKDLRHAYQLKMQELLGRLAIKDKEVELKDKELVSKDREHKKNLELKVKDIELKDKENDILRLRLELLKR